MEFVLRCAVPDRPGALAALAGAIGDAGGDIQAVDVVEVDDGVALDDLVVVLEPSDLPSLLDAVRAVDDDVRLIHAGASRGAPGDAVTRIAVTLEAILVGAMTPEGGVRTLVGGLLRAASVTVEDAGGAPRDSGTVLVLPFGGRCLVVRRDYRFTGTERQRSEAIVRAALTAAATSPDQPAPSGLA